MADVSGPVSTLPGQGGSLPTGQMCDQHPDRPAVSRIQGETDSFGAEYHDLCEECINELRNQSVEESPCNWCTKLAVCQPKRDFEEGLSGPVYYVCKSCSESYDKRMQEWDEMREDDYGHDDWDDFDWDFN